MAETKTNPDKFFLANIIPLVDYVMSPKLLMVMAGLIALGSIIFVSPLLGLMLNFLLLAITLKFAVDILLTTSSGSFDPDDVSFTEHGFGVIFQFIAIGILVAFLDYLAASRYNTLLNAIVYYVIPLVLPAIYMVLAYTGSLVEALNPVTLFRFVQPWLITYLIFFSFYLLTSYIESRGIASVLVNVVSFKVMYVISVFIMIFFTFLNFHIMGFLIYQNFEREEDDYEDVDASNSRGESSQNPLSSGNPIYDRIQSLIKSGGTDEALAIIKELHKDGDNSAELQTFKQQAMMESQNKKEIPVGEQVHLLIQENKIGTAFKLLEETYLNKQTYLESSEHDLTVLAKHAFASGKYPIVLKLLNGFNKNYPNSQDVVPNYYLVAQVFYKNPQTQVKALALLNGLIKKYPNHGMMQEIKSWAKGVELMQKKKPQI